MAYNTIKIKKYTNIIEEIKSTAAEIIPGMLVELDSTNGYVKAHAKAGGNAIPMFALEDELQGREIGTAYSVSTLIQVWIPKRGDQVYAILADGNEVDIGDFLESDGNGFLQTHTTDVEESKDSSDVRINVYPLQIVAVALEHLDTLGASTSSSESPLVKARRIKVRIV